VFGGEDTFLNRFTHLPIYGLTKEQFDYMADVCRMSKAWRNCAMAARKVRWGVLGAGGIARRRTIPEGIAPAHNAELTIVMDADAGLAAEVGKAFGVPGTAELEAVLAADVDVVYIATPNDLHADLTVAAAGAGKHVFVEKPIALTMFDADRMITACEAAGVKLMEGYMMRFHRHHEAARCMIAEGRLGELVYGRCQLSCWYPPITGAWRQEPDRSGGGALMDMATHCYALAEWLADDRIQSVFARLTPKVHDYPSDDSSCTMLLMASGCTFTVDCCYNIPDASVRNRLELYGSGGSLLAEGTIGQDAEGTMIYLSGEAAGYEAQQERDVSLRVPVEVVARSPYLAEVEYFSECILDDAGVTVNNGAEGKHILAVALAAYRSAESGRLESVEV